MATRTMSVRSFFSKQLIDVIEWTEEENGQLAVRYPMADLEIQSGAQLTVRESQMAIFVNEGRVADVFGPGLYTLNTQNLPLLTDLLNWDKNFESPFKSEVYFFSTRLQTDQKWGTATPVTIRDREFDAVRLRGYGIYSWHLQDPRQFHIKVSGTCDAYGTAEIAGQLRTTVVSHIGDAFANSSIPFLDLAANQIGMAGRVAEKIRPFFAELGLALDSFVIESLSLPEELQKALDVRIGMNVVGDLGKFTNYQAANSLPIAAGNRGAAGAGLNLGAGLAMGSVMTRAMGNELLKMSSVVPPSETAVATLAPPAAKFCIVCGKSIPKIAKFCSECGGSQV